MTDMIERITKNYQEHRECVNWITNNYETLKKQDWKTFIIAMAQLNPQSYGARIQRRLIEELNLTRISASEDKGDFINQFGDHYELKVSLLQKSDSQMHLVQIRPWQDTNYYFIAFAIKEGEVYAFCFSLSHERMVKELKIMNASAAHGTKKTIEENKNVEYRISMSIDSTNENFQRWFTKYRSNFLDSDESIHTLKTLEEVKNIFK